MVAELSAEVVVLAAEPGVVSEAFELAPEVVFAVAVWMLFGCYLDAVWMLFGCCLDAVWMMFGCCLDAV